MSFKSLNETETWNIGGATETKEGETSNDSPALVVTAVDVLSVPEVVENPDSEYDIPNSKESLQKLVANLKSIVTKLSEQIKMMSDSE